MKCYRCGRDAVGICRFCGRAICEPCQNLMPYIVTVYVGDRQVPKAVVVADALWCGTCRPQPEPIAMPEIY